MKDAASFGNETANVILSAAPGKMQVRGEGWRDRQPIYRLWSHLVHERLFGDSYVRQASDCLGEIGF